MPIATRFTNAGTLLVNGSFDENTSIAPAEFSTAVNTVYAGTLDEVTLASGAAVFNGTSQSLSVASNAVFAVGTGDFTVECWVYPRASTSQAIFDLRNPNTVGAGFDMYISPTGPSFRVGTAGTNYLTSNFSGLNRWYHLALSRSSSTFSLYVNGTLGQTVTNTSNFTNSTPTVAGGVNGFFNGYISNFRFIKGTGLYTANFTPSQTVLPAVSGTSLLLNTLTSANFTTDTSPNAFTVTNNGTATYTTANPYIQGSTTIKQRQFIDGTQEVYTQFDEFTGAPVVDANLMVWVDAAQTASYSGSGTTWTDLSGNGKTYTLTNSPTFNSTTGGGVITFAGASSQYATTAATLFNSTTSNAYSINIWVYPTGAGQIVSVDGQTTPNTAYHYTAIEITAAGLIYFGQWTGAISTVATSAQSLNAWYNLVITYNGTTATAYVNGTTVGSSNISWTAPGANTFFALMSTDSTNMSGVAGYASGSVGAFMVYNRALTSDEVTSNFNALRNRYGR
jgi:hypothetical protein